MLPNREREKKKGTWKENRKSSGVYYYTTACAKIYEQVLKKKCIFAFLERFDACRRAGVNHKHVLYTKMYSFSDFPSELKGTSFYFLRYNRCVNIGTRAIIRLTKGRDVCCENHIASGAVPFFFCADHSDKWILRGLLQ